MAASNSRPIPGAQQRRSDPLHYPEANYEPGQYPEGYYAPRSPRQGYFASPQSSPGRRRADSGVASTFLPGTTPPGQYTYPPPEASPRSPYPPQAYRTTSREQQYLSQPPPERTAYSAYSGTSAGPRSYQGLHPEEAHFPASERYPPPRPRGQSDAYLSRPDRRPAPNDDPYNDTESDRERESRRLDRRRRRRMSEGSYDRDHEYEYERRRKDYKKRSRKGSKSSYDDKRPTLADSTLWAFDKAKNYFNQRI